MNNITKLNNIKRMCRGINLLYDFNMSDINIPHDLKKEDIKYAMMAISMLNLVFCKEEVVNKGERLIYTSKVEDKSLEELILQISKKTSGGYAIGDFIAPDPPTLLASIRNSLAHGNFEIKGNRVYIYKEGKTMDVDIAKLSRMTANMTSRLKLLKKDTKYERYAIMYENGASIKDFLRGKCAIKPVKLIFERNDKEYLNMQDKDNILNSISVFYSQVEQLQSRGMPTEQIFGICFQLMLMELKKRGIIVNNEPILISKENEEKIRRFAIQLSGIEMDDNYIMSLVINEVVNDKKPKLNVVAGCNYNHVVTDYLEKNNYKNVRLIDVINNYLRGNVKNVPFDFIFSADIRIVALSIGLFMAIYGYPLDDVFKGEDIINSLDFSKLNMSMIKPKINKYSTKHLEDLKNEYNNILKDLNNDYEKIALKSEQASHITNLEALERVKKDILAIKSKMEEKIMKGFEKQEKYLELKENYETNAQHYYNKNIIEGIRNSIAHGNVSINRLVESNDVGDTEITFINHYKGEEWFNATIKLSDFRSLVSEENIDLLFQFCENKKTR